MAIVAIVGLVFISSGTKKITKSATEEVSDVVGISDESDLVGEAASKPKPVTVSCADSDGWNFELQGTASLKTQKGQTIVKKTDVCVTQRTGTYLREYYCASYYPGKISSMLFQCPYGCSNGACIVPTFSFYNATITCWDGYVVFQEGKCITQNEWYNIANEVCQNRCTVIGGVTLCGWINIEFGVPCG